jgi:D-sedoheptulose 7-phosphate isomerase
MPDDHPARCWELLQIVLYYLASSRAFFAGGVMLVSSSEYLQAAIEAVEASAGIVDTLDRACEMVAEALGRGGKLMICGNGGSAADAQHLAGELVCRFRREREAVPAIALSANSAVVTAIANDYSYEKVFSRQVEAFGQSGDILLAISTSGASPNVLMAVEAARAKGIPVVAFTGRADSKLATSADVAVCAYGETTSHVQEVLLVAGHALCYVVESVLCGDGRTEAR